MSDAKDVSRIQRMLFSDAKEFMRKARFVGGPLERRVIAEDPFVADLLYRVEGETEVVYITRTAGDTRKIDVTGRSVLGIAKLVIDDVCKKNLDP